MSGEIHICRGVNRRYFARVRDRGCRKWHLVEDKHFRTLNAALVATSKAFSAYYSHKQAEICLIVDYYDPVVLIEMRRP